MAIGNKRIAETAVVELIYPDGTTMLKGNGDPMWVEITGQDSRGFRERQRAYQARRKEFERRGKEPDAEAYLRDQVVAAVVDWDVEEGAQPLQCTEAEKRRVFGDPENRFLLEQVLAAVMDRAVFLREAAPPSSCG